MLSPSNKRRGTEGWREYERKRQAMLLGKANFIEIDLLRGGDKMPMLTPWPDSPYTLLVSRSTPRCRAWKGYFQRRLPAIPVPLLSPDPDLRLDLQPLLDGIYSLGRYDERIDYTRPLTPPLPDGDAVWMREIDGHALLAVGRNVHYLVLPGQRVVNAMRVIDDQIVRPDGCHSLPGSPG